MNEPQISYGTIKVDGKIDNDRIHHIFDYGLTGAGIGIVGHSEHTICGKYKAEYFHVYCQAVSISITDLFEIITEDKFCPICYARFKHYYDEHFIEDKADGSPEAPEAPG